jgi:acetyl-CoA C-acetyltransferase
MKKVFIVGAVRTAIGSFGGTLAAVSAAELGSVVIREALKRANIEASHVDEVFMGSVLTAGAGQNVARQAAIQAGISDTVCSTTVNMLCGSGMKTLVMGRQSILAGDNEIVVAGGTENMDLAPYALPHARHGYKLRDGEIVDTLVKDGLMCAMNNIHMGNTAENLAAKYGITREEQDAFAAESQRRAAHAQANGFFDDEIVPVEIKTKKETIVFKSDEYIKPDTTVERLSKLRPAFAGDGTVTAGNASGINNGAAALVLASEVAVAKYGLKPMAEILAVGQAGVAPEIMGIGPVEAVRKAMRNAEYNMREIQLIEANEAFAAQALSVAKELELDMNIVNVNGGAIALGHPIGASGARIMVTLLCEMRRRGLSKGLATACIGGGMGIACVVRV